MLGKIVGLGLVGVVAGAGVFWWITTPKVWNAEALASVTGDAGKGARIFAAAGCASCHAAKGAEGADKLALSGGLAFETDFGTFHAPNISQSVQYGIGDWSFGEFANAVSYGTSPEGSHYYPAFPYTTYENMGLSDLADLYAYFKTLPAVETPNIPHEVGFPFNIRRSLGGWKFLFAGKGWALDGDLSEEETRGRYLVEAMGHCAECHTPRNAIGGMDRSRWMAGGPNPDGKGRIPNITPHDDGIGGWAVVDIVTYLNSGFTPEFDVAGGQMADVVENTKLLPPEDHAAIAAYLKRLEPLARAE
ncbi:c-type cytochrome [Neptunicoccus sediminis]|uniref:c-type cytochrome n=1 Tax=Neptunicoccus sediminis TaxID=1892596 RepID=UPI000846237C|nr:cytochrome c [Neptunicoccus sediminis]